MCSVPESSRSLMTISLFVLGVALPAPGMNVWEALIGQAFEGWRVPRAINDLDTLRVIWKIDYYDKEMRYGSPDSADPSVTGRVMTVMLPEDY